MYDRFRTYLRGPIFEEIIKVLLEKNHYTLILPEYVKAKLNGCYRLGKSGLEVRGRGEWHQIDALGQFKFPPPFIYPVRLLCEAKCYSSSKVDLPVIRNFVGVLKDISENYFAQGNVDHNLRFTDCGAIFSLTGFTKNAENYAWAHGIKLISYEDIPYFTIIRNLINHLVQNVRDFFVKERLNEFRKEIYDYLSNKRTFISFDFVDSSGQEILVKIKELLDEIKVAPIGLAAGGFPVHIISDLKLPEEIFIQTDEVERRVRYENMERYFVIEIDERKEVWKGYFAIPLVMMENYVENQQLLEFKERFLNYIDIPWVFRNIRRILRLRLDREWLEIIRSKRRQKEQGGF